MPAKTRKLRIETAEVFEPLLQPARYKAAWGGRGSGKSYFFATAAVEACLMKHGTSVVCIREVQRVLAQSSKKFVDDTIRAHELEDQFEIQDGRLAQSSASSYSPVVTVDGGMTTGCL
jgi:phage terminase large subunit